MLRRLISITVSAFVFLLVMSAVAWFSFKYFIHQSGENVPDLTGMTSAQALESLKKGNFYLLYQGDDFSDMVPSGAIMRQEPGANTVLRRGRTIKIILSKGSQGLRMPDLRGKTKRQAEIDLTVVQMNVGRIVEVRDSLQPAGQVISQDPGPGESMPTDGLVHLLVSVGPESQRFVMPRLIGFEEQQARLMLNERGLQQVEIRRMGPVPGPEQIVLDQLPQPGQPAAAETQITLSISSNNGSSARPA